MGSCSTEFKQPISTGRIDYEQTRLHSVLFSDVFPCFSGRGRTTCTGKAYLPAVQLLFRQDRSKFRYGPRGDGGVFKIELGLKALLARSILEFSRVF